MNSSCRSESLAQAALPPRPAKSLAVRAGGPRRAWAAGAPGGHTYEHRPSRSRQRAEETLSRDHKGSGCPAHPLHPPPAASRLCLVAAVPARRDQSPRTAAAPGQVPRNHDPPGAGTAAEAGTARPAAAGLMQPGSGEREARAHWRMNTQPAAAGPSRAEVPSPAARGPRRRRTDAVWPRPRRRPRPDRAGSRRAADAAGVGRAPAALVVAGEGVLGSSATARRSVLMCGPARRAGGPGSPRPARAHGEELGRPRQQSGLRQRLGATRKDYWVSGD